MKKKLLFIGIALIVVLAMVLTACGDEKSNPEFTVPEELSVAYGSTLGDLPLPDGFSWQDELTTSVGEVGQHTFLVTYTPADTGAYNVVTNIEVTITVTKANPTYTKPTDLTAIYGQTLADVNLPAGFAWVAPTTPVGNVGKNDFAATYTPTDTAKYNVVGNVTLSVTVRKADLSGITFGNGQFTYDGTAKSISVAGLPEGATVQYTNNGKVNVGTYDVTAVVSKENYNDLTLSAKMTIVAADIRGLSFVDKTVTFDGQTQSIAVTGLPDGATVQYTNNEKIDAGTYEVTAVVSKDNYNDVTLKANLVINKATMTGVTLANGQFTYDGTEKSISVAGLPEGATVRYTNNGKTNAGSYDVTAVVSKKNYNDVNLSAKLNIAKATVTGISFSDKTVTYNGTEQSVVISGNLPAGVSVEYEGNEGTDAGIYNATATFTVNENYNEIDPMNAKLTIEKAIPVYEVPEQTVVDIQAAQEQAQRFLCANLNNEYGLKPYTLYFPDGHVYVAPMPMYGNNVMYAYYAPDANHVRVDNIAFNVLGWDSDMYTVRTAGDHYSVLYLAEEDVTLRMVCSSDSAVNAGDFDDMVGFGDFYVYAYTGRYAADDSFENVDPFAVYEVSGDGGVYNLNEYTYVWPTSGNEAPVSSSFVTRYVVSTDENLSISLFDLGTLQYVYANEADNITLALYQADEKRVFTYDGIYTADTLPRYGTLAGNWDVEIEDELLWETAFGNPLSIGENDVLRIDVGESQYTFGYWDDAHFGREVYVVMSFDVYTMPNTSTTNEIRYYLFDEEVNYKTIDLSDYEPSCGVSEWVGLIELGDDKPSAIACDYAPFTSFDIEQGELVPTWEEQDWLYKVKDVSGNDMTFYFRAGDGNHVYNITDNRVNTVEQAQSWYTNFSANITNYYLRGRSNTVWEMVGETGRIVLTIPTDYGVTTFEFMISPRNGGTLVRNVGEVEWIYDCGNGIVDAFTILTIDHADTYLIYEYASASIHDILIGKAQPPFNFYAHEEPSWEDVGEDGIVAVVYDDEILLAKNDEDHTLTYPYGTIYGVLCYDEYENGMNEYIALTLDGKVKSAYAFLAESIEDVVARKYQPVLGDASYYFQWTEEDGYIHTSSNFNDTYYVKDGYVLTVYMGEIVDEYEELDYSGEGGAYVGGYRITFNEVCGQQKAFRYESEELDGSGNPVWLLCPEPYSWKRSDVGGFINVYEKTAFYEDPCFTYYYDGEGELIEAEGYFIDFYGYAYDAKNKKTWVIVCYEGSDSEVYIYDGILPEKDIPTLYACKFDLDPTVEPESVVTTSGCEWSYCGDNEIELYIDKPYDYNQHYYFYYNGIGFASLPDGYEIAYFFTGNGETEFYLRSTEDESKNISGWTEAGDYTTETVWHAICVDWNDGAWLDEEADGKTYLVWVENGFPTEGVLVEKGAFEDIPLSIVYHYEKAGYTYFYVDQFVAKPVYRINAINLTDDQISATFAAHEIEFLGVWFQDGDYVRYVSCAYISAYGDGDAMGDLTEADDVLYQVKNEQLAEPDAEYYGKVVAIMTVEFGDPAAYVVYAFVDYFGEYSVVTYGSDSAEVTLSHVAEAYAGGDHGDDLVYYNGSNRRLSNDLFLIDGKVYEVEKTAGVYTVREVSGEVVYWAPVGLGPRYIWLFVQFGDTKAVFVALDEGFEPVEYENDIDLTTANGYLYGYMIGKWMEYAGDPFIYVEHGSEFEVYNAEIGKLREASIL